MTIPPPKEATPLRRAAEALLDQAHRYSAPVAEDSRVKFLLSAPRQSALRAEAALIVSLSELFTLTVKRIDAESLTTHEKTEAFITAVAGGIASFTGTFKSRDLQMEFLARLAERIISANDHVRGKV